MGATFADRHQVFSHVGSGELPGVPGSSREVFGRALGAPEGSFWVQFRPSGNTLGPLFDDFSKSFMSCGCSERRNVCNFVKICCGNAQRGSVTTECTRRSSSLENKTIGAPLISQPLTRIFHGKHLGGAALPGVGGRGRRPFQSADPGRGLGVRGF